MMCSVKAPMRGRYLVLILWACLFAPGLVLAGGVKGRIAFRGELVSGVSVAAYSSIEQKNNEGPVAVSSPTGKDGRYRLDLKPGTYYCFATSGENAGSGPDFFAYDSDSPVQVAGDEYRRVNFSLVPGAVPLVSEGEGTLISGRLLFKDELLERVYLSLYSSSRESFKGPGMRIIPVEKGEFRVAVAPGSYYLIARKRLRGGRVGPLEVGDFFGYFPGNPVSIDEGEHLDVRLEMISRHEPDSEVMGLYTGVVGRVLDRQNYPQAGVRVFAYLDSKMKGTPDFFTALTRADGVFRLELPGAGSYHLLARESFGKPVAQGELYGRFARNTAVVIEREGGIVEGDIVVEPYEVP